MANQKVDRFWSRDAQNIRCVRESDYDALLAELSAIKGAQAGEAVDCEWCAGARHDYYGAKCEHCQTAPPASGAVPVRRELLEIIEQSWRVPNALPKSVPEHVEETIKNGLSELRALLAKGE